MKVFISYRREDSNSIAGRIRDSLARAFGDGNVFKDDESLSYGHDFGQEIKEKVGACDALVAIIGPYWLTSAKADGTRRLDDPADWVRIEIEAALERGIPVVPLLVNGAVTPRPDELPPTLAKLSTRNGLPVRSGPDFPNDMGRLTNDLARRHRASGWTRRRVVLAVLAALTLATIAVYRLMPPRPVLAPIEVLPVKVVPDPPLLTEALTSLLKLEVKPENKARVRIWLFINNDPDPQEIASLAQTAQRLGAAVTAVTQRYYYATSEEAGSFANAAAENFTAEHADRVTRAGELSTLLYETLREVKTHCSLDIIPNNPLAYKDAKTPPPDFLGNVDAVVVVGVPEPVRNELRKTDRMAKTVSWFCGNKLDVYVTHLASPWASWEEAGRPDVETVRKAMVSRRQVVVPCGAPGASDFAEFLKAVKDGPLPSGAVH